MIMKNKPAILMVHGLGESIDDNLNLYNYLQKLDIYDIFMYSLPGSNRRNKLKNGYHDWIEVSEEKLSEIEKEYENIYIIGHSMGGVLSSYLASKHNVKKLILVAPAFGIFNIKQNVHDLHSKIKNKSLNIIPDSKIFYDIVISRFLKVPISSYRNFLKFTHKYKNCIRYVDCDTLIIYGLNDEIVPNKSIDYAFDRLSSDNKLCYKYKSVGHVVFESARKEMVNKDINDFLIGGKKWKQKKKLTK